MLPKSNRLPGHLIPHTLNSPTTLHSPFFGLKVISSSSHLPPRLGFIVSTKIAKRAVDRNKIKRLLRQAVYPHLPNLKPGHDLLFLAKHPLKNQTLQPIKAHVFTLLKQAKLLTNEKASS
jgi:ribonuclease P protein component